MSDGEHDPVDTDTIVRVVHACGSKADVQNGQLCLHPKGGHPVVMVIPQNGFRRRSIIEIARRCGFPARYLWHPEQVKSPPEEADSPRPPAAEPN